MQSGMHSALPLVVRCLVLYPPFLPPLQLLHVCGGLLWVLLLLMSRLLLQHFSLALSLGQPCYLLPLLLLLLCLFWLCWYLLPGILAQPDAGACTQQLHSGIMPPNTGQLLLHGCQLRLQAAT